MKVKMGKLIAVLSLAVLLVPGVASANLLTNPGFETGDFSGWGIFGSAININNNVAHSGSHSVTVSVNSPTGIFDQGSGSQDVAISDPNIPFLVGGWLNQPSSDPLTGTSAYATIAVQFRNGPLGFPFIPVGEWSRSTLGQLYAKDTWNDFTAQIVPSDYGVGIASASIMWQVAVPEGGSGSAMFDDLIIEPVPEPASLLIFGVGLLGFGLRVFDKKKAQKKGGESENG